MTEVQPGQRTDGLSALLLGERTTGGAELAPAISVMCSAYRCEDYLAATIESVLAQTVDDWELIVVDNGMSEAVVDIVQRYRYDPRVRLLRQENRRLAGGLATAAAAARGRYLVPLDSDDLLMPEFCRRMTEVLDTHPEIDALSCDSHLFVDGEERDMVRSFLRETVGLDRPLTLRDLIGAHDVIPYFAAFRRDAWFAGGGYAAPDTHLVEDIALFLRLVTGGFDVRVLPERLTRYRMRDDSTSRDPSSIESFERNREAVYRSAAEASGDPVALAAFEHRVRKLRYEQALRRARWAFRHDDLPGARAAARTAFGQRRTLRGAAVLAGVTLAPALLKTIYPAKQYLGVTVSRIVARLVHPAARHPSA